MNIIAKQLINHLAVIGKFVPLIFFYSKVMRHIKLSETEKKELAKLYETSINAVIKRRCKALLMSNMEIYSMQEIVDEIGICRTTLYHLFNRWEFSTNRKDKFKALSISKGRGAKPKLDSVKDELPKLVEKYNGKMSIILQVLKEKYGIKVCRLTLAKYLGKLSL